MFFIPIKIRETYISETGFPFSPVHFALLKSAVYGKTFAERTGLQLGSEYFFNNGNNIQPFIFINTVPV